MRLFSYIVRYDFGFAPNPFEGYCTVATCKPDIRRAATVGDWIVGTGSAQKSLAGRLVYAMEVGEVLSFDDYWKDVRFARKVPTDAGAVKRAYGDNIYHHGDDGEWIQADSRHSLDGGEPNPEHLRVDTGVDAVLIGNRFSYFGGSGPAVPTSLREGFEVDLVHSGRGHRCRFPNDLIDAAIAWFDTLETGVLGRPADWGNFRNFRNHVRVVAPSREGGVQMSTSSAELVSPTPTDADGLAKVLSFLEAHEARHGSSPEPVFFLSGADEHDSVELTEQLHAILKQVVQALSHGQSISILTRDQEISTQQAAEILGLSRPTVVKLIDSGELRAHVPGAVRRKLRLADVLAYREELRARRNQFLTESSAEYDEADADDVAELLAEARRRN